jgi:hypothetical protein
VVLGETLGLVLGFVQFVQTSSGSNTFGLGFVQGEEQREALELVEALGLVHGEALGLVL